MSTYLIWILRFKLILPNNQSIATLWVLDTCLSVGLLPLIIILITASLFSKIYNWDLTERNVRLWGRDPHATIDQHLGFPFVWVWMCFASCLTSVSRRGVSWCFRTVRVAHCFYHHIPQNGSRKSVHSQSRIQRNNFRFCRTVGYWRLLFTHPADRDKCSASEDV